MAETYSSMLPLGTKAPDFNLFDTQSSQHLSLNELSGTKGTVIMFICNHCPYVKLILPKLVELAKHYQSQKINFIAISSNDVRHYPADSPQLMQQEALKQQFSFPYLYDETQTVAIAYQATCTPDFFVFDENLLCVYRGRFDEATPGNQKKVSGNELAAALDNLLAGKPMHAEQHASVGCNIKWKKK